MDIIEGGPLYKLDQNQCKEVTHGLPLTMEDNVYYHISSGET